MAAAGRVFIAPGFLSLENAFLPRGWNRHGSQPATKSFAAVNFRRA
jgi:hypothetical protein